ncbi:MAG: nucleoside hydrolase [Bacillota bacterium]
MQYAYSVRDDKKIRVLIDTDAACEADDPFAIAHALMSPKLIVKGILAEQFGNRRNENSTQESYDEIKRVTTAMGSDVPVYMGAAAAMRSAEDYELSDASQAIISQALSPDPHPLFVLCMGALTNVACALRERPEIAGRMTIVAIGGMGYGASVLPLHFREFNFGNDVIAANTVMGAPGEFWQIPADVYITIRVGIAELETKVLPHGRIGRHLFEQLVAYNQSDWAFWTAGESWSLGDSPAVGVALHPSCGAFEMCKAPWINEDTTNRENPDGKLIRVYRSVDSRYILEDFFAKLTLFTQNRGSMQ